MDPSLVITFQEKLRKSNLTDRYIFQHSVKPVHIIKPLADGIVGKDIGEVTFIHDEMTQSISIKSKDTRYDILIKDSAGTIYDVEMENRGLNIHERADYYQAMLAVGSIDKGTSYKHLAMRKVIIITNFDPFGAGLFRYNVECKIKQLPDKDSKMKFEVIYFNLQGKRGWDELSPELQDFVKLAKNTTAETAKELGTQFGKDLFEQVEYVKNNELDGRSIMGYITDIMDARDDGREEGRAEGIAEGRAEGVSNSIEVITNYVSGMSPDSIAEKVGMSIDTVNQIVEAIKKK